MSDMGNQAGWLRRRGNLREGIWESVVDGRIPGWAHTGLRVASLADGIAELDELPVERLIVPLAGSFEVEWEVPDGQRVRQVLQGRGSVFEGPSDVLYLGSSTPAMIRGSGRVAVAEAPTAERKPAVYIPVGDIPIELRGAGAASRQVHNFGTPTTLDAVSFIVCEVITPAANWSSWPSHKHDEHVDGHESRLEEIYYFEAAVSRGAKAPELADPFGLFATYSSRAGEIEIDARVRTGDIALVPFGYHGPAVAALGYDLYYLNVMAGPDPEREWLISDDPAHGWIRDAWEGQEFDPRLPYTKKD